MSCSGCSINKGSADGSKGGCSSGGCSNKLNVYNWLQNMSLPQGQLPFPIVEVRFKGSRKEFFKNTDNLPLGTGDVVAVEGNPGHDIGVVSLSGELVRSQLKKKGLTEESAEIKSLYRKARQADVEKWQEVQKLEKNTMYRARSIASQLKLTMKLSDVEYQGDGKKATFYYTADERVDFRELIKRLADEFRVRIEMRQIGMRQEASRLGGIGSCGRELCCSSWLSDFRSVSTSAARYQNLSLNPIKLAGQCGKLKCCLNYELDSYMDALKEFPDNGIALKTQKGRAFHRKTDIFKGLMWYSYESQRQNEETFEPQGDGGNWVMLKVDRVKEIIAMNQKNILPEDLAKNEFLATPKKLDYENVVGQDSITRMDKSKGKNRKEGKQQDQGSRNKDRNKGQDQRNRQEKNKQQAQPQQGKQEHRNQQPNQPKAEKPVPSAQQSPKPQQPKPQQQQQQSQAPQNKPPQNPQQEQQFRHRRRPPSENKQE